MNTATYDEVASTAGAQFPGFRLPAGTDLADAMIHLADQSTQDMAITAVLQERGGFVDRVALIRDPSVTRGAPDIDAFQDLVTTLSETKGWRPVQGAGPAQRLVVMLGLREGYDPAAQVHTSQDVGRQLYVVHGAGAAQIVDVHLMSARYIAGVRRIYGEPGVLIGGPATILPAVTATAAALRQHRFVVVDRDQDRTYALRRS